MLETRKKVEADLKEYPMLKRKETILKYESQHPQHVTEHEVIGCLLYTSYTLLELDHPSAEKVHVSFQGAAGSQVKVDVIT